MLNLRTLRDLIVGVDRFTSISLAEAKEDNLSDGGLTMGTLYIGKQGTGKTTSLARHLVENFKRYPDRAIFILDWSGSLTDSILTMILGEENKEQYLKRVIYDQLGNDELVVPMPEFSALYGKSFESQVQRVVENIERLDPDLIKGAPVLGGQAVSDLSPQFFRLLTAITNDDIDPNETWQITEARDLMSDMNLLKKKIEKYGYKIPETVRFLKSEYIALDYRERDKRTFTLKAILNILNNTEVKARLGYYKPAWTPQEAIDKGKLVLVDGAKLIGQKKVQSYLFTQLFSLIMAVLKSRRPADPNDQPVSVVLDEVYPILSIPGMATEISQLAPLYRSRKLQFYIVLQNLAQLSEELRPHIWNLGNIVSFAIFNFKEAYEMAEQLFMYDPKMVKLPAIENHNPMMEGDRGQFIEIANRIQRLKKRECIIRNHSSEAVMDSKIYHVAQTKTIKTTENIDRNQLESAKDSLLRERAIPIREALEKINTRHLVESQTRPTIEL